MDSKLSQKKMVSYLLGNVGMNRVIFIKMALKCYCWTKRRRKRNRLVSFDVGSDKGETTLKLNKRSTRFNFKNYHKRKLERIMRFLSPS